jgi:uncharacterized protein with ParB-like and HNH nuclease domain
MKANELPINNFLQAPNVQFVIPVYQRNYDWTTDECNQLVNDILSVEKEDRGTHFIGSIVFIHEGTYSTSEVKQLVIIDGQQRLTTINIFYVALYRFAKENNLSKDSEMLYNMFLVNQYVENESSKLKLKQTDTNSLAFKAIMNSTENQFHSYSNVIENYNFFRDVINEDNFQTLINGLKRLIFVEISLERGKDDPQRIFESLNSTGLELTQSDLIRNFILMDLEPKEQNKVFENIWNPIEENARDLIKQNSLVSDFIRDYITLKTKKIPNKNKVYIEFKKLYAQKSEDDFNQELENIKQLSFHYKKLINPNTISDHKLKKEIEYISRLEINVAFPFLLQVFDDSENGIIDSETLLKVVKLIQSYAWRRFVVGLPTNALNKIFMTLYSEIDHEEYYDSLEIALIRKKQGGKFPTNEDLRIALQDKDLYNIKAKNRNYMFELLENYNNREYVDTSNEKITIEHIFPRNPNEDWKTTMSETEYTLFKDRYLNTIGNLTLSGNNGALSNKSFSSKKEMNNDGGEQGYKYSRLWLNHYLKEINNWSIKEYNDRSEFIYERFLSIWQYPSIQISHIEENTEENIFDIESATNKKLDYFIFENTKIDESAVAQMYFYVIKELFKKNTQLLVNNQEIIKSSKSKEDFRSPQEIINGYFVEFNIDSNSKFKILKKLLSLFELEEELTIKFSSENDKESESRFEIRKEFWKQLLPKLNGTSLFSNVNPTKSHWLSSGAGFSGIYYTLIITGSYVAIEFSIARASKQENKRIFNQLLQNKNAIESSFGSELIWEELKDKKMSKIIAQLNGVNLFEKEDWDKMSDFLINNLPPFELAFNPLINDLKSNK